MGDRYDARSAREMWQRLLWRPAPSRRLPSAPAEALARLSVSVVDPIGEKVLLQGVTSAFGLGWQPAEIVHIVTRRAGRPAGRLVDLALTADHDRRVGQLIDPRWQLQIDRLQARTESTRQDWLRQWRRREDVDRPRSYDSAADVWWVLSRLGRLPILVPLPGTDPGAVEFRSPSASVSAYPMLERIRKLLAKAESTEFPAEAEALTAKAQALMARHVVDRARLEGAVAGDGPRMVRILLEAPYAAAKSALLGAVAESNRCRAIGLTGLDMSALVGHEEDLASVEVLYTSLLVQAGNALAAAAHGASAGDNTRSAAFRHSFHLGFASRIRERLATAEAAVLADPSSRGSLPVLRSRASAVDEEIERIFGGRLSQRSFGGRFDPTGAAEGRAAADLARLNAGELSA